MPGIAQLHIDNAIPGMSLMYQNTHGYIADRIAPVLPVEQRSDKYFVYDKTMMLQVTALNNYGRPKSARAPGAVAQDITYSVSTQSYFCEEYPIRQFVSDEEVPYADAPLQPKIDAAMQCANRVMLDNENAVSRMVGTRGSYASTNTSILLANTASGATHVGSWSLSNSNAATVFPIGDIHYAKVAVYNGIQTEANSLMVTVDGARIFMQHVNVKDFYKYSSTDGVTASGMWNHIAGLEVLEGNTQGTTSVEGSVAAAQTFGSIWLDSSSKPMALVYYANGGGGPRTMNAFRTFAARNGTTGSQGISVRNYRDEARAGEWVEASITRDWAAIAVDGSSKYSGAYLFSDIVS